jgi:hypothetical protein
MLAFLRINSSTTFRSPIGKLASLRQPRYTFDEQDPLWECKQTADPTDWFRHLAQNMSGGEEATFAAAASVMAPNPNHGLLGNPIELNKFVLTERGQLATLGPGGTRNHHNDTDAGHRIPSAGNDPHFMVLDVQDYLPQECRGNFSELKSGLWGRYLRVVATGMWDTSSGCGAEIVAVSPPAGLAQPQPVSVALVRVIATSNGTGRTTQYLRVRINGTVTTSADGYGLVVDSSVLGVDDFGVDGTLFYDAIAAQSARWDAFASTGAVAAVPPSDQRYADAALALLTEYLNVDRGLTPEYGAGKVRMREQW